MIGPRWLPAAARPAAGALAGAAGWLLEGTLAGALLWVIACVVACGGYGLALERATGARLTAPLVVTAGLAAMLVVAAALGMLGLLAGPVRAGLMAVGVALAALPRVAAGAEEPAGTDPWFHRALAGLAALVLVGLALVRLEAPIADDTNYVLAVKRLWDTGALDPGPRASGLYVVGDALFARGGGAESAAVFEAVCAALLVCVIAGELSRAERLPARLGLVLVAAVIVIRPPAHGQAAVALLHLAAFLSLGAASASRRVAWHALGFALALALVRLELAFLAAPYAAAAVALPRLEGIERPSGRRLALAIAGGLAVALAIQLALGQPAGGALGKSFAMLAAAPFAALLLGLLGPVPWRGAYGALCAGVASFLLAVGVYAIPPPRHAASATAALGTSVALVLLLASVAGARPGAGAAVRAGTASLAVALLAAGALLAPAFGTWSNLGVANRFRSAVIALRERAVLGADRAHEDVRAAQLRAPEGARLAFWGRSAARLDFARNPIRDVSFANRRYRDPIAPRALDGVDFLVLEDLRPSRPRGGAPAPALAHVADRVELVAAEGTARLFRVRP